MQLGLSIGPVVREFGYETAFQMVKQSGFDAVDIDLECYGKKDNSDIYGQSEDAFASYFDNVRRLAEQYELVISQTHGRCWTYTPDPEQCEYALWVSQKDLLATKIMGAPACVIHGPASSSWPDNYQDPEFMHRIYTNFNDELTPTAEKLQTKFSLETFGRAYINNERLVDFFADANVLKRQYEMIQTSYKTLCMDTGHTNEAVYFGTPSVEESIRILGKDISLLHLHDNNTLGDQHLAPLYGGYGAVNWANVFDALEEIGYAGVYNFELNWRYFHRAIPEAIVFLGKYLRCFIDNKGRY